MRSTVNNAVKFRGIGLHNGQPVVLTVAPAAVHTGIVFHRTDVDPAARPIPARYDLVSDTHLCTGLANGDGLSVGTVEHLMAALAGCGITDARITLDGPEVPIMDGSAVVFVRERDDGRQGGGTFTGAAFRDGIQRQLFRPGDRQAVEIPGSDRQRRCLRA
jgi:UDP-3-O-[3-hydroxymyristoyl] N-acetylglucosamine deacetylase